VQNGLTSCISTCASHAPSGSKYPAEADGSTDCSKSRLCGDKRTKCYRKNPYWASCKMSCDPHAVDSYDGSKWDCSILKPLSNPLLKCTTSCQSKGGDKKSCIRGCLHDSHGEGTCEKDGATDCSTSKCCQNDAQRCFTKNPYYSACKSSCKKGSHDSYDKEPWDCKQLDNSGGGKFGQCLDTCMSCKVSSGPMPTDKGWDQCAGGLTFTENGVEKTAYIMNNPQDASRGSAIKINGDSLTLGHGPRVYFGYQCQRTITPGVFLKWNLVGQQLSYTVDLSNVGCACNAALYFVSMAAGLKTKCDDYYCDANAVCGSNCAELDIQEGNTHAWATTAHNAYSADGDGKRAGGYGPGKTIDPARGKIDVKIMFHGSGSELSSMETTLSQSGGHQLTIKHEGNTQDMKNIAADMASEGMVPTLSHWGGAHKTMDWLDGDVCGTESCNRGEWTISNIAITGNGLSDMTRRRRRTASNLEAVDDVDDVQV